MLLSSKTWRLGSLTWWATARGKRSLTNGLVLSQLLGLSTPIAWGLVVVLGCNLVDALLVSRLGSEPMAVYTLTFPLALVASNLGAAGGVALTTLVAREVGERDWDEARRLATDSLLVLSGLGALLAALTLLLQPVFLPWLTTAPTEQTLLLNFLPVYLPSLVLLVIGIVGGSALRATGNTFWPSMLMSLSALLNIGLDAVLIPGLPALNIPALGLLGVGWAALISRSVVALLTFALLLKNRLWFLNLKLSLAQRLASLKEVGGIALPSLLGQLLLPLSVSLVTQLLKTHGSPVVAAYGLAYRVESFALIGLIAFSTALLPFVAQNAGAGQPQRIEQGLKLTVRLCLVYGLLLALLFIGLTPLLVKWLPAQPALKPWATLYLSLLPTSYWGIGLSMVLMNALYAQKKPWKGMLVAVGRLFVLMWPLAWLGHHFGGRLFAYLGNTGLSSASVECLGLFVGLTVANTLTGLLSFAWLSRYQTQGLLAKAAG